MPKPPALKPVEELSFEEAYAELELLVETLEDDQRSLDDAMELFERGQALIKRCAALLDKAELKVKKLSGESLEDFEEQD